MNTPREILTRAKRLRRAEMPARRQPPAPAPRSIAPNVGSMPQNPMPEAGPVPQPSEPPRTERPAAPKPAGHALYRELMRSHDRTRTRHLNGPG